MKKAKRRSYRDRYFENWQAVKEPAHNRKGYRMVYHYVGSFRRYAPARPERTLQMVKREMLLSMLIGAALYVPAMLSGAAFTHCRIANGLGVLSVVAWLIGMYGLVRFTADGEYMKAMTADEVDQCIRIGWVAHAVLLVLSALAGAVQLISGGSGTAWDIPVILAVLGCAACSLIIRNLFSALLMTTHKNVDGKPIA